MKTFKSFHPLALFLYFASVLVIVMFTMHPVMIALSLVGCVCFFAALNPLKKTLTTMLYYFFLLVLLALINPLFSHNGVTPLFFMNGNPITLESIVQGLFGAGMLVSVLLWFKCYSLIMTSDKFVYLFGRISPKISLMIAMALRFVPDMNKQAKRIRAAQKTLGLYSTKSYFERMRSELRVFSALLTWSIENSVVTADSMRARGYGQKGRSNFSIFVFRMQDGLMIAATLAVLVLAVAGIYDGRLGYVYYPRLQAIAADPLSILIYTAVFLLMMAAFVIELEGSIHWRYLRSKI